MSFILTSPNEIAMNLAKAVKEKRLSLNYTQKTLAERSGVSLAVVKKFEQTGKISLQSLLKIALVLDALDDFNELFKATAYTSINQIVNKKVRKRGRK